MAEQSNIGNIKALREWTRRYFYTKQDINYFITKLNEGLKGYTLMIIGPRNKRVTINPGNYQFTLNSDGWYRYIFFFNRNQEITLSVQDGITMNYQLDEYNDTICLSPWVLATPQMTDYHWPEGYVSAVRNNYPSWRAFDRNADSYWEPSTNDNKWLIYEFTEPRIVYNGEITLRDLSYYSVSSFSVQGSNDNTNWTTLYSKSSGVSVSNKFEIDDPKSYLYYRFWFVGHTYLHVTEIKLYTINQSTTSYRLATPTMTSATAPSGRVTASNENSPGWKAFDNNENTNWQPYKTFEEQTPWIKYQFTDGAKCIKKVQLLSGGYFNQFTLYASNDDTNWDNLGHYTMRHFDDWYYQYFYINNSQAYTYYKLEFGTWTNATTQRMYVRVIYLYEEV